MRSQSGAAALQHHHARQHQGAGLLLTWDMQSEVGPDLTCDLQQRVCCYAAEKLYHHVQGAVKRTGIQAQPKAGRNGFTHSTEADAAKEQELKVPGACHKILNCWSPKAPLRGEP